MSIDRRSHPCDPARIETALDWLVRLRADRTDPRQRVAFEAWRRAASANEAAAAEAEALWQAIAETQTAREFATTRTAGGASPVPPPALSPARPKASRPHARPPGRRAWPVRFAALAATFLLAILAVASLGVLDGPQPGFATSVGERRTIVLADGSTATLNAETALSMDDAPNRRVVTLHTGEALFVVAPDPARPFLVRSGGGEARALGTTFQVRNHRSAVSVVVASGTVAVRGPSGAELRLSAGQQARYSPGGVPHGPIAADPGTATAWSRGRLVFNRRPLGEVTAELERHLGRRILVVDGQVRALLVTGVFDLDRPDTILPTLREVLDLRLVEMPFLTLIH